ncbi:M48 family metalloprotease [Persicitalea sp.]|uniref:M48 family metalloprotease n=1 Tax=Persicitalea sp. TaxID=3100273 RepID=UPI0035932A6C
MKMRKMVSYVFLIVGISSLYGCSRNPVTGKRELILMSQEQELAAGKEAHPSIVASMGLYENQSLQAFINQKGKAMGAISHRPDLPYQFFIVDSPVVNAFAVPGGYVYFTRGIMAHFNNEAEFAGVLGHEIGHITARHSARQQTSQLLGQLGAIAGTIALPEMGEVIQAGVGSLMLSYSRAHETESDEIGVAYSSKIGYDAHQMADFFGTLKKLSEASGQIIPTFQSTHPDPGNRQKKVAKLATEYQQANPGKYEIDRNEYLKRIDGIIYGEDPKQGFVENDMFYHPVLKFQFPVPRGWQHQNAPTQFQMAPKGGKAVMIFTLAQGNSLEEAAQATLKGMGLEAKDSQKTTINGNPALVVVSRQAPPQQQQGQPQQQQTAQNTVQVATWFIQYGGNIYAIHGMSYVADFDKYASDFKQVAEGFRTLTDREKLNRQPDRIQIKSVQRDGTLRSALEAYQMPADKMKDLEVLNGMDLKDPVTRGMMIKTISR